MNSVLQVKMGDLQICSENIEQISTFVGSCIALCLYNKKTSKSGLAHIMVAGRKSINQHSYLPAKYSENALESLIEKLSVDDNINELEAKIIGGAHIFKHESGNGLFDVGKKNIESIKQLLKHKQISLVGEDTGLDYGRWVYLETKTGKVHVKGKNGFEKIL